MGGCCCWCVLSASFVYFVFGGGVEGGWCSLCVCQLFKLTLKPDKNHAICVRFAPSPAHNLVT